MVPSGSDVEGALDRDEPHLGPVAVANQPRSAANGVRLSTCHIEQSGSVDVRPPRP